LDKQRAVVEHYLRDEDRQKYQTAAGKLGLIRAVLAGKVFKPDETYKLQCLGIVLGDAFVKELKMEWVMIEDEHGRDPAVRLPATSIILCPLTMISKRIERGDEVDVFELFNGAATKVEEMRKKASLLFERKTLGMAIGLAIQFRRTRAFVRIGVSNPAFATAGLSRSSFLSEILPTP